MKPNWKKYFSLRFNIHFTIEVRMREQDRETCAHQIISSSEYYLGITPVSAVQLRAS